MKGGVRMNKRKSIITAGLALVVAMAMLASNPQTLNAQDCRVIRIHGMAIHNTLKVEPETLQVSKGTCVIWFNRAGYEVKVIFEDGKQCASVSDVPVGFSLDHDGCYVTSWIPVGATSSLRFQQEGALDYTIKVSSGRAEDEGGKETKGRIIVR
jgi:plastocyanin